MGGLLKTRSTLCHRHILRHLSSSIGGGSAPPRSSVLAGTGHSSSSSSSSSYPPNSSSSPSQTPIPPKWRTPKHAHATGITIYNCVARQKVPLLLRQPHFATWYACGPTVYAAAHIGHASCYVKQDLLQRTLREHFGIRLVTAMNITDVDDKIIECGRATGEPCAQLAARYEAEFWSDLAHLGCRLPDVTMRVSECMPQIVAFVEKLLEESHAYSTDDGSVYFAVDRYTGYGKLQRLVLDGGDNGGGGGGASSGLGTTEKRGIADFALWKGRIAPAAHEPHWSVPWSAIGGRPGWHVECSAMASHLFGGQLDFHAGGLDLRFPHHENEEAQSCAHHDCDQWVNYWIHVGQLSVLGDSAKMSKSLQNTIGVTELLQQYTVAEFRMLCLLSNYQNAIEFGPAAMDVARAVVKKLNTFAGDCESFLRGERPLGGFNAGELAERMMATERNIDAQLRDNLNTSKSVELLLDLITYCNREFKVRPQRSSSAALCIDAQPLTVASPDLAAVVAVRQLVDRYRSMWALLGGADRAGSVQSAAELAAVQRQERSAEAQSAQVLARVVNNVLRARNGIRQKAVAQRQRDLFLACDAIRDELRLAGVHVKDAANGKTASSSWSLEESALMEARKTDH